MSNLQLVIHDIKGIKNGIIEVPIENGVYALVGNNGVGKSTIMSCLAQLISAHNLEQLKVEDYTKESYVKFIYNKYDDEWFHSNGLWKSNTFPYSLRFNGTYEGSLFYGMRFRDSKNVDDLMRSGAIQPEYIVDADTYITEFLGKILHNDTSYYQELKRIKNKYIAEKLKLNNTPYFRSTKDGLLISQYRMSSGECLLISLLHFIYNSLVRRSLPTNQPVLMLIDEIELALHPVAINNLMDLLYELVATYKNLTVIITSHSPEVIRKINPSNLFKIERINSDENEFNIVNPCYTSYAIRDIYTHDGFDFLLLVEDELAKRIVKKIIEELKLNNSRLINVLPVGGWANVLNLQREIVTNNILGVGKKVCAILDGDIQKDVSDQYQKMQKLFLPINSVEKFLKKKLLDESDFKLKKEINDTFFTINSIDSVISEYRESEKKKKKDSNAYKGDSDGKGLYKALLTYLNKVNIKEEEFINYLCIIIRENIDFTNFNNSLSKLINQ